MSALDIPEAAYDAADEYPADKFDTAYSLGAIDAAAPVIVAAELRRLAAEIEDGLAVGIRNGAHELIRDQAIARKLRDRADELDGGAR